MSDLNEQPVFEPGIYRIEQSDPVVGGEPNIATGAGVTNIPALQLANRTRWLREALEGTGWGEAAAALLDDWDDATVATGHYQASSATAGLAPSGGQVYHVIVTRSSAASMLQLAIAVATGRAYTRSLVSGGASPWRALAFAGEGTPAGAVQAFATADAPAGWLAADGAEVARSVYPDLFAAIGTAYGDGDGLDTFNLPDLRGEFVRGLDAGRGVDPGRGLGTRQGDATARHDHAAGGLGTASAGSHSHATRMENGGVHNHAAGSLSTAPAGRHSHDIFASGDGYGDAPMDVEYGTDGQDRYGKIKPAGEHDHAVNGRVAGSGEHAHALTVYDAGAHDHPVTGSTAAAGGGETRPRNLALLYCIKT